MTRSNIAVVTQAARDAAEATAPVPSRFKKWACRHSPGATYPEETDLYPGQGRHTFSRGWHSWGPGVMWQCGCNFHMIHVCRICGLALCDHQYFDPSPPAPSDLHTDEPMPSPPAGHRWRAEVQRTMDGRYMQVDLMHGNKVVASHMETIYFYGVTKNSLEGAAIKAAKTILKRRSEAANLSETLGIEVI